MTGSEKFYSDLPAFTAFEDFSDFEAYAPLPDDWVVLAGDIRGSTVAIREGRYKDVNMLGAAVITAVLNACPGMDLPFVFGGDGGAVAVPGRCRGAARQALARLQHVAERTFRLGLRAAAVPVVRLRREGHDVTVRRLRLNGSNHLAMFGGGGIDHVDRILKGDPGDPDLIQPEAGAVDLEGLTCRWEPLQARHGRMIALMVLPIGAEPAAAVFRDTLAALRSILDGRIITHAPARKETMKFRWPPRSLIFEARMQALAGGKILRKLAHGLLTSAFQVWCHWRGVEVGDYHGVRYLEELRSQTDFRKFDGSLRTVLDCSDAQVARIAAWLEQQFQARRLVYGLHADTSALMTCLVFSLKQGEHVHFVDAAGGGFASAAVGFKDRLKQIEEMAVD